MYEKLTKKTKGKEVIDEDVIDEAEGDNDKTKEMADNAERASDAFEKMSNTKIAEEYPEEY